MTRLYSVKYFTSAGSERIVLETEFGRIQEKKKKLESKYGVDNVERIDKHNSMPLEIEGEGLMRK